MTEIRVGFREPEYFLLCFAFLCAFCALCVTNPEIRCEPRRNVTFRGSTREYMVCPRLVAAPPRYGETPLRFSIGGTDGIRPHDLPGMTGTRSLLIGGAGGIRTPDLLDAIEARSQLRHGPTGMEMIKNCSILATRGQTRTGI